MSEQKSRFQFDTKFLKAALLRLVIEPYLVSKFRDSLSPELFDIEDEHSALKRIAKIVLDKSREGEISVEGVWSWIQMLPDGPERQATMNTYNDLRLDEDLLRFARSDQVFETFLQYLKAVTFLNSHKKVKEYFDKADFELAYNQFERSLAKIKSITLDESLVVNWKEAVDLLDKSSNNKFMNFQLGIEDFDRDASFEPQSFNMFVAASGGGKSMMSIHLGIQAIKQGKKAFMAFCEDKPATILRRLYACYTGIDIDQLKNMSDMPPEHRALVKKASEAFEKYLHVEFPYAHSHLQILENFRNMNERNRIEGKPMFEVLVLDYIGHIAHMADGDALHEKTHRACSDLKDFALQNNIIVFTHLQTNRSGAGKSSSGEGLIDMSTIAGSYNSAFVADNIISINRSEEMIKENKCIFFIVKGREGAAFRKYEIPTQFSRARFDMKEAKVLTFAAF
jgi:KaiC/GvpD/RAD55 family RecA-like ATPase